MVDEDGELVCVKPFPSQPTHFWNDEDGIRYSKAYFSMFKGELLRGRRRGSGQDEEEAVLHTEGGHTDIITERSYVKINHKLIHYVILYDFSL